jgi:hypothetical protein
MDTVKIVKERLETKIKELEEIKKNRREKICRREGVI